jgi:hypothetical protein
MCEFCHAYFMAMYNFQPLSIARKINRITFKVTYVANGQLTVLLTPRVVVMENFQRLFQPIQQPEVTF